VVVAGVDGRAAGQEGYGLGGPAVVAQRGQQRVTADQIVGARVAARNIDAAIARDDRVVDRHRAFDVLDAAGTDREPDDRVARDRGVGDRHHSSLEGALGLDAAATDRDPFGDDRVARDRGVGDRHHTTAAAAAVKVGDAAAEATEDNAADML